MLILYHRPGCHLCDEAREILAMLAPIPPVREVDITADPAMLGHYGTRIPVLAGADWEVDWPFGPADVAARLR
jgi:hypothetical protein